MSDQIKPESWVAAGFSVASTLVRYAKNSGASLDIIDDILNRLIGDKQAWELIKQHAESYGNEATQELEEAKHTKLINDLLQMASSNLDASIRVKKSKHLS